MDDCDFLQTDADWDEVWAFFTDWTSDTVNVPRDISAYVLTAGALRRLGSSDPPMVVSVANGLLQVAANQVVLHVPADNAAKLALAIDDYLLDLVLIDNSGNRAGGLFQKYRNVLGSVP